MQTDRPPAMSGKNEAAWRALVLLTLFHAALGLALISIQRRDNPLSDEITNPALFAGVSWFFMTFAALSLALALLRRPGFRQQVYGVMTIDIIAMLALMNASGGLHSFVGLLLALSLSIGSLLTSGVAAFTFAALAAAGMLGLQAWAHLAGAAPLWDYAHALILGLAFFLVAFLAHSLTARLKSAERAIVMQAAGLADLHEVNAFVIEHLDTGILVLDAEDRILMHNQSAERLLAKAIPGHSPLASIDPRLGQALLQWKHGRMTMDPIPVAGHPDADIQVRIQPLSQQAYRGAVISLEDLARARAEAHKIQLAVLGKMTASIAHEIRNPLSAIRQAAQILSEAAAAEGSSTQLARVIARNSVRLDATIENVLRLASPTASPQREALALCPLVRRLAEEIAHLPFASDAQIDVICLSKPTALIDPRNLEQILLSLCENAVRHSPQTPEGLTIRITIRQGDEGEPTLCVTDSGPGIDPEIGGRIFEPFFSTAGSTGLGLYLVRALCEANGGNIRLAGKNFGQGATFVITLAKDASTSGRIEEPG